MAVTYSYSKARESLAAVLEQVTSYNEIAIITRRNRENVAMISESEMAGLIETAHLLRSPKNAKRLLAALNTPAGKKGIKRTVNELRKEFGLEK